MSKKFGITAMALGIASLVLGLNGSWTYMVCGVAGLVCAIISFNFQKKAKEQGQEDGFTKAAKITSIIGIIVSAIGIVWGATCILCSCFCNAALASAGAAYATSGEAATIEENINDAVEDGVDNLEDTINDAVSDAFSF